MGVLITVIGLLVAAGTVHYGRRDWMEYRAAEQRSPTSGPGLVLVPPPERASVDSRPDDAEAAAAA